MWEVIGKIPAWRLIWISILALVFFLVIAGLISEGSISDQTIADTFKFLGGIFLGGTGGYAAGARVRKGEPHKWSGKEERRKKH